MDAFLMLACLGPFNAEETSRGREFDVAPSEVALAVKGGSCGRDQVRLAQKGKESHQEQSPYHGVRWAVHAQNMVDVE